MSARKRSLSLTSKLDDKLVALCDELGVTPNSYINNAVAKAVMKDSTHMVAQQSTQASVAGMLSQLDSFMGGAVIALEDRNLDSKDLETKDLETKDSDI